MQRYWISKLENLQSRRGFLSDKPWDIRPRQKAVAIIGAKCAT